MITKLQNCQNQRKKPGIFVIVCGICQAMDEMQISKWHNRPKNTQMLHKNKACLIPPKLQMLATSREVQNVNFDTQNYPKIMCDMIFIPEEEELEVASAAAATWTGPPPPVAPGLPTCCEEEEEGWLSWPPADLMASFSLSWLMEVKVLFILAVLLPHLGIQPHPVTVGCKL